MQQDKSGGRRLRAQRGQPWAHPGDEALETGDARMSRPGPRQGKSRQRGVVTVEFAVFLPFLVAFLVGIVEFGHLWWLEHALTNASREGARYAVMYRVDAEGARVIPTQADITAKVRNYLLEGFYTRYDVETTRQLTGDDLEVRVTARDNVSLLIGPLLVKMGFSEYEGKFNTIHGRTTMKLE